MKFTIAKHALLRELSALQQTVAERKVSIPALSYLRLEASRDGCLRLVGTDLDQTLTCETAATVYQVGACALPGRKLLDLVRHLPDAPVTLETKANQRTDITCGRARFKLAGLDPADFPEIPVFQEAAAQLPAAIFRAMIERTRFAITQDESRYTLSGAKFFLRQRGVRLVATDGTRLSLIDNRSVSNEREFDCLIPKKALQALAHLAAGHEGDIGLSRTENHLHCAIGPRQLVTRLLAGEFPAYEKILPRGYPHQVQVESAELLQTVRRVAVLADERNYALRCEFSAGQLRLAVDEKEEGAAEEVLPVTYAGELVAVGLNARYLMEYLAVLGAGPVQVEFRTGQEVVEFKPLSEPGFNSRMLLMPLRLEAVTPVLPEAAVAEAEPEEEEYAAAA